MAEDFELLRRLHYSNLTEQELLEIYYRKKDSYAVLLRLVQQPKFPERFALNIIPDLFPMDLIRVIKNMRTRPYIRQKAELEFRTRYLKFPMGEKLSYMKVAPHSLLQYFVEENDKRVIDVILNNSQCTESLLIKFINRKTPRFEFYKALDETDWYKRPQIASLVADDIQAPVKMMLKIIPFLAEKKLLEVYERERTHLSIKKRIAEYVTKKKFDGDEKKLPDILLIS